MCDPFLAEAVTITLSVDQVLSLIKATPPDGPENYHFLSARRVLGWRLEDHRAEQKALGCIADITSETLIQEIGKRYELSPKTLKKITHLAEKELGDEY